MKTTLYCLLILLVTTLMIQPGPKSLSDASPFQSIQHASNASQVHLSCFFDIEHHLVNVSQAQNQFQWPATPTTHSAPPINPTSTFVSAYKTLQKHHRVAPPEPPPRLIS